MNGEEWVFNNGSMWVALDLAIGGTWPGDSDNSTVFPQQLIVDYVRVYERDCSS